MNPEFRPRGTAALLLLGVVCLLAIAGCGSSSHTTGVTGPVNNTVPVTANIGPMGAGGDVDVLFVTVTVCQHGTSNCAAISNVKVDTGSIGLRLVPAALGSLTLTPIMESGAALQECIQYADTSYSWGPMELADVEIAGEKASDIPVQVLGSTFTVPPSCLTQPVNSSAPGTPPGNEDTLQSLGANGILGIGGFIFDCDSFCANPSNTNNRYFICPSGNCTSVAAPTANQAVNPVAEFTSDNNGVMITLPAVPATGTVTVSGTMTFGIGTQTDNALGSATLYAMDACASFPMVTFKNVSYTDSSCNGTGSGLGGFLDTGSNGLFVSDASTLTTFGIVDCAQGTSGFNFYCVNGGTTTLSDITLFGFGGVGTTNISLNIRDATMLFSTNNAVFNDLGGDSVPNGSPSIDSWDLGLPFFLGRTVFVGIAGEAVPGGANAPNGFVAF